MKILCKVVKFFMWISVFIFIVGMIFDLAFPVESIPLIVRKEFPFVIEYEIDGDKETVKDELICEFVGYDLYTNDMRCIRKWTSYLKSGRERITLFKNGEIEIFYSHKSPNAFGAVYLGDTEVYSDAVEVFPNAWFTTDYGNNKINPYIISAEEMMIKYNIKLLNYTIAPPIKNIFINYRLFLIGQVILMVFLYFICYAKIQKNK